MFQWMVWQVVRQYPRLNGTATLLARQISKTCVEPESGSESLSSSLRFLHVSIILANLQVR